MATTIMRDSIVGDQWIYDSYNAVPIQKVYDDAGNETGDFLSGPVRLAFDNLFTLPQVTDKMQNPKYGSMLLFPPCADLSLLEQAEWDAMCAEFADYYDQQSGQFYGLHSPFRNQAEKVKFGGFTPGCIMITATSKFKPPVVDVNFNPIVDPSKVYPGVWAICSLNQYVYKDPRKKGVGFGLQSVMIIGDDSRLGGGPPDPNKTLAGARGAISAPIARPDMSRMPAGNNGQQAQGIPGYTGGAPASRPAPGGMPGRPVPNAGMPGRPVPGGAPAPTRAAPGAPAARPVPGGRPAPAAPSLPSEEDDYDFMN